MLTGFSTNVFQVRHRKDLFRDGNGAGEIITDFLAFVSRILPDIAAVAAAIRTDKTVAGPATLPATYPIIRKTPTPNVALTPMPAKANGSEITPVDDDNDDEAII